MDKIFYCFFAQGDNIMGGATFAFGSVTDERVPSLLSPRYPAAANVKSKVIHAGDWKPPEFGTLITQSDPQGLQAYSRKKKEMYASIKAYLTQYEGVAEKDADAALKLTEQNGIEAVIAMTGKILVGVPVGFVSVTPINNTGEKSASSTDSGTQTQSKSGCYIATAVYGSYDAPEVMTLRRFRDGVLAKNMFGRLFIRFYYRVGPIAAKKLNKKSRINTFVKLLLDKWVINLDRHKK